MAISVVDDFCEIAKPTLDALELSRVLGLENMTSPLGAQGALFKGPDSLFLDISIDTYDSNAAQLRYGRKWTGDHGWWALSTYYYIVARHYQLALPNWYRLGSGSDIGRALFRISEDLLRTLPTIRLQIRLQDLIYLEGLQFGVEEAARMRYGTNFNERVTIGGGSEN